MTFVLIRSLFLLSVLSSVSNTESTDPPGHLQPLGSHMEPLEVDEMPEFPHPISFYEDFVKPGVPLLLKSVLQKEDSKPLREWTDEYLGKKFGKYVVEIEKGKKETRGGYVDKMELNTFLKMYTTKDIYLVQDLTPAMMEEIPLPYSLQCGGVQNLLMNIVMWFSSGGTKSVLHMDDFDNINCLLDGTKDFIIFDQIFGPDIEADGYVTQYSYSGVDVDRVDMYKFPKFQDLPYYKAHMEKGDCLFIPTRWYHQVNSYGSRNLAVNTWFLHPHWFNATDCADEKWNDTASMNTYPLAGIQEGLREMIIETLDMTGDGLTETQFLGRWKAVSVNNQENSKVFQHLDTDKNGLLTWGEIYKFDVESLYQMFPKAFGNEFRRAYQINKNKINEYIESRYSEDDEDKDGKDADKSADKLRDEL